MRFATSLVLLALVAVGIAVHAQSQRTVKPVLHGRHWVAITGKPLGATAGALIFSKGGNAVDATCAMLGAVSTMWDTLGWGGETQALIYNPKTKKVIGINALGVAPTGATPAFFKSKGMDYPPEYGPLAAVTPGTPGGLMVMLAEYGTMSLKDVLAPAIQMADGYPIEASAAGTIERQKAEIKKWPPSAKVFLTHPGEAREAPEAGEVFVQADLAATLRKLVDAEQQALAAGKTRKEAIYAAYDRFYKGDIAREFARGSQALGGLLTYEDLATWKVKIEEPVMASYKGIDVYKLTVWTQGPALLQALNMLEGLDVKAMGYNSPKYVHALYQVMNLAFADRDFYYGDPDFAPEEPVKGLLSKEYAAARVKGINWEKNDPDAKPGDPYPFQGGTNPFKAALDKWGNFPQGPRQNNQDIIRTGDVAQGDVAQGFSPARPGDVAQGFSPARTFEDGFTAGTTSIQAADAEGWVVSVTPSGGWIPAAIAGSTGIGMSQRMQSFVTDPADGPYNVLEPRKRPRVTLTPTLALKDGRPFLSFAVQGGDTQDQNLLQFFLNVVEFGMNVQQATEAANINSYQMRSSFDLHKIEPGRMTAALSMPQDVRDALTKMGYKLDFQRLTSGPINAIFFDWKHKTFWGGSSTHGEDYGIAW
jgi:gamma-glutamyltranspeptidase/glutathione hydrolase